MKTWKNKNKITNIRQILETVFLNQKSDAKQMTGTNLRDYKYED